MLNGCLVRDVVEADLPLVRAWRNHESVRRNMLTQHEITSSEHHEWFAEASLDPSRSLLIVEEWGQAIGFVQFIGVEDGGIADWGFYTSPEAPKGSGRKLGMMALSHGFDSLKLHKVCGQVIDTNAASISFHHRMGFKLEGVLRDQHRAELAYHSLHCFGLINSEWHPVDH